MTDFESLYANAYGYAAALLESWLPDEKPYPRLLDVLAQIKAAYEDLRAAHEEELKRHEQRIENDRRVIEELRDQAADYQGRLWCALGQPMNIEFIEAVKQMRRRSEKMIEHLRLIEHKIDQHLQGQYAHPPFPALGVALAETRKALMEAMPLGPEDPMGENFG